MTNERHIAIVGACEHNLKIGSLNLPLNKLVVVTGVSGSGKSSLIFDTIYREAESRYLGSFSSYATMFMGKMHRPRVERIEGLSPAIAVNQRSVVTSQRSTVGTLSGIYDLLRLLFARCGEVPAGAGFPLSRSLFSFNSAEGACPACKGLGVEDFLDPDLLIADDTLTLRQGALVITAPNGYIIYSQVTLDVLDQVCRSEGFNIDIPWKDMTPEQRHVVLYGSNKLEIPFGKHPLESRMKWTGITAKPREMGYYRGILPIMEEILRRDRNKNILRFVRTMPCRSCQGSRLNERARSVTVDGHSIASLTSLEVKELGRKLKEIRFSPDDGVIADPIIENCHRRIDMLCRLGLGYLSASRESASLSGGESQRLRLVTLALMDLSGMLFIFDEPSIGIHHHDTLNLIGILKAIRDRGNSVIVVEHDPEFIRHADWLTDIGPGPGLHGGEVMYNGPAGDLAHLDSSVINASLTLAYLLKRKEFPPVAVASDSTSGILMIGGACVNNLRSIDVSFMLNRLNVVTGVSGAGKSSLVDQVLVSFLNARLSGMALPQHVYTSVSGYETVARVISIDQSPIGRTPRSNPATYTGLSDHLRDLFSRLPESKERGYDKSRFSFNTAGGRCETCQGAGYIQLGMHFMENVEVVCDRCEGRRFDNDTLEIGYQGKNLADILEMRVEEALLFFAGEARIARYLETMESLGLGYLTLGQRSSTLSGGEAQRIKLAAELAKVQNGHTLYVMDEPSTGLHQADVEKLLQAIGSLIARGHTVVVMEHHPGIIMAAHHIIDLGPGSGNEGGTVVVSGTPEEVKACTTSLTGMALHETEDRNPDTQSHYPASGIQSQVSGIQYPAPLSLAGITTHNLRNISLDIPKNAITVITGVSGSGKSSLAFDTIHAEAQNRFMEGFSPYVRSRMGMFDQASFESVTGLTPTLALQQSQRHHHPRSTVGTVTGLYDLYRLLFSRIQDPGSGIHYPVSSLFSFNHHLGACQACDGLGEQTVCDASRLITDPSRSILDGAMDGTRTGKFYGDPYGQYVATLKAVGSRHGVDFSQPWDQLGGRAKEMALQGTGEEIYDVTWSYKRGQRTGEHHFTGHWQGLLSLVEAEYGRKHADRRGDEMMGVMTVLPCAECHGARLNRQALAFEVGGKNIAILSNLAVSEAVVFFGQDHWLPSGNVERQAAQLLAGEILQRLQVLNDLGLSYLSVSRKFRSLSSGEARRVRLASQLHSGLTGITYVLDEPSAGLHPDDIRGLMFQLAKLRDAGNTLILVEHNRDVILAADHVVDLGPGAGKQGGEIVATGTPAAIMMNPYSLTGKYLANQPEENASLHPKSETWIRISGAVMHNLKGFDLSLPMNTMVAVTGVSGSGKSSLVFDLLYASWEQGRAVGCRSVEGIEKYTRVQAIGIRGSLPAGSSVVATYTGIMDQLRTLFAGTKEARAAGFGRDHFSFVNKQGQCLECQGAGVIITAMDFLPDVEQVCDRCGGQRFSSEVLAVNYAGRSIADVLDMTVGEALPFFGDRPGIAGLLEVLVETGLEYITLGQRTTTLSGGEAQRLHLATELIKPASGTTLYLFDEPTTGLHPHDIKLLLSVFKRLIRSGHTIFVTGHDPLLASAAGYLVELGPEGGAGGGYLIRASSC